MSQSREARTRPPESFDEYRLVRPIGRGGMGHVYLAHDTMLDRPVAIKVIGDIHSSEEAERRFLLEARAAARLTHPNVVVVYRIGQFDGRYYIASEYISGKSLDKLQLPLPGGQVLAIAVATARGLAAAHDAGVLHRDIKPANTILAKNGDVKLVDFGLAKLLARVTTGLHSAEALAATMYSESAPEVEARLRPAGVGDPVPSRPDTGIFAGEETLPPSGTMRGLGGKGASLCPAIGVNALGAETMPVPLPCAADPHDDSRTTERDQLWETRPGERMGTPYYMAPELWRGEPATAQSDIYAVGAMLYELVAGVVPAMKVLARGDMVSLHSYQPDPLVSEAAGADPRLCAIIDRCLHLDPGKRYGSADALRVDLEALQLDRSQASRSTVSPSRERNTNLELPGTGFGATFVGRQHELGLLREQFEHGTSLITVRGTGGTGKTRLAQQFGLDVVDECSRGGGGVWICELNELRSAEAICGEVAQTLGVPLRAGDTSEAIEQVGVALAGCGRTLVILDNFEHLIEHARITVGRWLALAPNATFLVTSREALHLREELLVELPPLVLPAEDASDDSLLSNEAVRLFLDRAQQASKDYRLAEEDLRVVAEIVARLDGIPLAIELAAARTTVLTPEKLLTRLSERFRLLKSKGQSGRHGALRGAIDWSWDLLGDSERAVLAQCSVFRGGFYLEAAEQVLSASGPDDDIIDIIQELREKSLLRTYRTKNGELRFAMYESIREYAEERLIERSGLDEVERRHAAYYLEACEEHAGAVNGPGAGVALDNLSLELDNVLAVCRRAEKAGTDAATITLRAALAINPALEIRGPYKAQLEILNIGLTLATAVPVDEGLRARVLHARGKARQVHGMWADADIDYRVVLDLARQVGDSVLEATALVDQAVLRREMGHPQISRAMLLECQPFVDAADDLYLSAYTSGNLGAALGELGEHGEAREQYAAALERFRALGDERSTGIFLANLGLIHCSEGALEQARGCYSQALGLFERVRERRYRPHLLYNLATLDLECGDVRAARRHGQSALELARKVGDRRCEAAALGELARFAWESGELDEADRLFTESVERLRELNESWFSGVFALHLAGVTAQRGDTERARQLFQGVEEGADEDDPRLRRLAYILRGHLDLALWKANDRRADHCKRARQRLASVEDLEGRPSEYERMAMVWLQRALAEGE